MQDTDINETEFRAGQFEDFAQSPIYSSIAEGKPDGELRSLKINKYKLFINIAVNKSTKDFYFNCYFWYTRAT